MPHESPKFESRVHELLDERRAPEEDSRCQSQAALSAEDKEFLAAQQLMLDGLECSEIPELPADFAESCVAAAMQEADSRPQPAAPSVEPRWHVAALVVGLAVAIVVAVPLFGWLAGSLQNGVAEVPEEVPQEREEELLPDTLPNPKPNEPDTFPPTQVAEQDTTPSANELAESEVLTPREPTYEDLYIAIRGLREQIPATDRDEQLIAALDDMATGLRPVADSVGGAINALRRNLPPAPKAEEDEKPQAWMPTDKTTILS